MDHDPAALTLLGSNLSRCNALLGVVETAVRELIQNSLANGYVARVVPGDLQPVWRQSNSARFEDRE